MKKITLTFCLLGLLTAPAVQADEAEKEVTPEQQKEAMAGGATSTEAVAVTIEDAVVEDEEKKPSEFVQKYIAGKLQIGTRTVHRILTDEDSGHKGGKQGSGTFLGTIYALEEEQDYVPKYLYLRYNFSKYIGAELAYDSMTATTKATSVGYSGIKSDGDVILSGPTVSLIVNIPTKTKFTPYGSIGVGFYSGDFDETAHWGLGYPDPGWYEYYGSPTTLYGGRKREMEVDDATGLILGAGCTYDITDHWILDFSVNYTSVDPDATFYGYRYGVQDTANEGHFPMDNIAFRLGIAYEF